MSPIITVRRDVLATARLDADAFRREMAERGTLVVNLISSPGAGKTSLLSAAAAHWQSRVRVAVLVGDLETDRDARRLASLVPTVQLTTGGACHLERSLVQRGYEALACSAIDILFIENVGNLVCPSSFDLGEHLRIVMLSVTEGDDKPAKYPKAFRTSQAMVISKIDLLPHVPFTVDAAIADARTIQPKLTAWPTSSTHGLGIEGWCAELESQRNALLEVGALIERTWLAAM